MSEIKDALQKLGKNNEEVYSQIGKVVSVDVDDRTCEVEPLNGDANVIGVRLQANLESNKGFVIFPKIGSEVVVTFINKQTGYLALFSEIDKVSFSKGSNDLLEMMQELISILKEFQLSTNMGATIQVMPHVIAKLDLLENQFKDILK